MLVVLASLDTKFLEGLDASHHRASYPGGHCSVGRRVNFAVLSRELLVVNRHEVVLDPVC